MASHHPALTSPASRGAPAALLGSKAEALKTQPTVIVAAALRRAGVDIDDNAVAEAVEASSFARMRAHEEKVTGDDGSPAAPRVIREGKTNGWKGWMTPELAGFFTGPRLHTVAAEYGYDLRSTV